MRMSDSMMIKLEICVICENTIQIDNDDDDPSFWGYDAQPIKEGVCCFDCWLHEAFRMKMIEVGAPQSLLDRLKRKEEE